jgi:PhnO protein
MDNIEIRSATTNDLDSVYHFVCGLESMVFDKALFAQYFNQCIATPHHHYLIALVNNQSIGYISCHGQILLHHCGMVYEIQELFVDEKSRDNGIGKLLLEALYKKLGDTPYELLEVCSNMRRTDAHRFYLSNGFEQTSYKFKKIF